jgi:hypothetical protein
MHQLSLRLTARWQVDVLANSSLEVAFVAYAVDRLLDCAVVKVKGRTVTVYR